MSTAEPGQWVMVWVQVAKGEVKDHPEDVTVRFESHNEHFNAPVRLDRVVITDKIPEFAIRCSDLYKGISGRDSLLWQCVSYHDHPGLHTANSGSLMWKSEESYGYVEEK